MTKKEMVDELIEFINSNGQWHDFLFHLQSKGYTEDEFEEAKNKIK